MRQHTRLLRLQLYQGANFQLLQRPVTTVLSLQDGAVQVLWQVSGPGQRWVIWSFVIKN